MITILKSTEIFLKKPNFENLTSGSNHFIGGKFLNLSLSIFWMNLRILSIFLKIQFLKFFTSVLTYFVLESTRCAGTV